MLVIQNRISSLLLNRYDEWMQQASFMRFALSFKEIKDITWSALKERLPSERLLRKSIYVLQLLEANNYHWEETCWVLR
jgi:hypothetical protein